MNKNTIGTITTQLLAAYGSKPMTIRTEGSVLVIKANGNESRFVDWENTNVNDIIHTVGGTLSESTDSRVLLRG